VEWACAAGGRSGHRGRTRYVTTGPLAPFRAAVTRVLGAADVALDEFEDAEEEEDGERAERDAGEHLRGRVRLEVHP
jgi:hypothetical protein